EPCELDEGAIPEHRGIVGGGVTGRRLLRAEAEEAAERAVFSLLTGIDREEDARAEVGVVRRASGKRTLSGLCRVAEANGSTVAGRIEASLHADRAAKLDAGVSTGDVKDPRAVQTADLHVFDRLGLDGKIGRLRPRHCDETRRGAEEK